jgi:hypothetical protein
LKFKALFDEELFKCSLCVESSAGLQNGKFNAEAIIKPAFDFFAA